MSDFTEKLSAIGTSIRGQVEHLYAQGKERAPVLYGKLKDGAKATAVKAHNFIQTNPQLVRTACSATCLVFSPISFTAGFLTPTLLSLAHSFKLTKSDYSREVYKQADSEYGRDVELGATVASYFMPVLLPFVAFEQGCQLGKLVLPKGFFGTALKA